MRMSAAPMMPTGCAMTAPVVIAMVTRGVPLVEVRLEAVVVWTAEAEASWYVIIATKLGIWLAIVRTLLRHVDTAAR